MTFGQLRYVFFRTLLQDLHKPHVSDDAEPPEASVCLPPREREELVATLKTEFKLEEIPPPDTQLEPDDMADPEDLESSWLPGQAASSSAVRHLSADTRAAEEPSRKRAARTPEQPIEHDDENLSQQLENFPKWAPGDKQPLDHNGEVCAHYRRRTPLLNKISAQAGLLGGPPDNVGPYVLAKEFLLSWLQLRPGLRPLFATVERRAYDWDLSDVCDLPKQACLHDWGAYFWCPLKQWLPAAPDDVDVHQKFDKKFEQPLSPCIHAASMYSVHKTMMQGLHPGPLPGKGGRTGVFVFKARSLTRAQSSSGYAVYSRLHPDSEFLVSPRFAVLARMGMSGQAGVGKMSVGADQYALQPGTFFLEGVWFHVLTMRDACFGPPTWVHWDDWDPEFELFAGS